MEIQKNQTLISNEEVKLGYLFAEILSGNRHSENELRKVVNYVDIDFPENFFILVLKSRHDNRNRDELTFLVNCVLMIRRFSVCVSHDNEVIIPPLFIL
ncbi:hypothetical protein LNN31_06160 [Acetobacterium wieringae]|uniref:Uncharacterized protein n=1 Tax=Acetobacterium wieringae TaxID=52694 RepID=A0ABY6HHH9_9FIRM|nr:hypothetical protein [Acetobacterium wieringae]MEA4807628.1 hypothetical protein [Acetobacterium wieringae]UYO63998.1 hypothetical protein LNN31_06160 [Acetobacterium wieringae]